MIKFLNAIKYREVITDMSKKTYRIVILVLVLLIVGCTEKDEGGNGPLIQLVSGNNLISTDTTISPGQLMQFEVTAIKGNYNITNYVILVNGDSSQVYYDTGMNVVSFTWSGTFAKSFNDNEVWEFIARDRYSRSDVVSILILNDSSSGPGPIYSYTDIQLGAQTNQDIGGCFSLSDQLVYFIEEAFEHQEAIDIIYYFGEDNQTVASPGSNIEDGIFPQEYSPDNWLYRNTTRYIKTDLDPDEFNLIQNDSLLLVSYIEGEGKRKAKELVINDVYSFRTQASKYGMFLVKEVMGAEAGSVKIDIKIQE